MPLTQTEFAELTYRINGLAMQVHSELRPGHRERLYQRRLAELLAREGLLVEAEKRVEVFIDEALVGFMYLDLWVEQRLVVECKAFPHLITNDEVGQVITYLVATGSPLGLLYNFGRPKLNWKRILPPRRVQSWQRHLYRCVWTPPGQALPPLETIRPETPIRFSVFSPQRAGPAPSALIRLSASSSAADPSAPSSAPSSAVGPSAPIRLSAPSSAADPSASSSAADPSAPIRLSASSSAADPSAPIRLSASSSVVDPSTPSSAAGSAYAASGVSITAGNRAVDLMRAAVQSTYGPEVLAGLGAFGGLFDASALQGLEAPVLVASTDGVGTKVKVAAQAGRYASIGHDLVNHCVNDILVQGARPLFFLDYVAADRLVPEHVAAIVGGLADACRAAGCALLGGETAEMPGVYAPGEFDLAGTIVGVVERAQILPRPDLQAGDVLIGLRSSGPHTNGYALIRRVFAEVPLDTVFPTLGRPLADVLLEPHRSYLPVLSSIVRLQSSPIKALAHLTGGGFVENIPRVLPEGLGAVVRPGAWPVPPIFDLIQARGAVAVEEMHRVFNMGIGMVLICAPAEAPAVQAALSEPSFLIGELVAGERRVKLA